VTFVVGFGAAAGFRLGWGFERVLSRVVLLFGLGVVAFCAVVVAAFRVARTGSGVGADALRLARLAFFWVVAGAFGVTRAGSGAGVDAARLAGGAGVRGGVAGFAASDLGRIVSKRAMGAPGAVFVPGAVPVTGSFALLAESIRAPEAPDVGRATAVGSPSNAGDVGGRTRIGFFAGPCGAAGGVLGTAGTTAAVRSGSVCRGASISPMQMPETSSAVASPAMAICPGAGTCWS
jgi:hypothetical protein